VGASRHARGLAAPGGGGGRVLRIVPPGGVAGRRPDRHQDLDAGDRPLRRRLFVAREGIALYVEHLIPFDDPVPDRSVGLVPHPPHSRLLLSFRMRAASWHDRAAMRALTDPENRNAERRYSAAIRATAPDALPIGSCPNAT